MGKILSLPPELIAKIAAGEVVERPASVVKELVENSLDAGSGSVRVEIQGGGRKLIRVVDDGEGMAPDEALLSVQRYTTSKIHSLEDLFSIHTFGFRGEALSSIAAVSRMKITSRKDGEVSGVEVSLEGGFLRSSGEAGCPPGTSVEVRDLFFNVPARLKFLKSSGTEIAQISEGIARIALANPRVRFQVVNEGKILSHYPVRNDLAARISEALGKDVGGKMFFFQSGRDGVEVSGYAGEPGLNRPNSRGIYLFVNRRPVRDRLLSHAVMESFRNLIPRDRYPVAILFVQLRPSDVDVNVHPSKWEVKFSDSEAVHGAVIRSIREMLARTPWLKEPLHFSAGEVKETPATYPLEEGKTGFLFPLASSLRAELPGSAPDAELPFSFLGQVHQTYLIFSSLQGVILVDQHAAHERITLERLLKHFQQGAIPKQQFLFPEILELSGEEAIVVEEHTADLARMGFELSPSGRRTYWVKSGPEALMNLEPLEALKEMIKEISSWGKGAALEQHFDPMLKMMACRGSIQAHRPLQREEAQALLTDLQKCTNPSHCPHGRPTLIHLTLSDLEKLFGRK